MADCRLAIVKSPKLGTVQKLFNEGRRPCVEGVRSLQDVSNAVIRIPNSNTHAPPDFDPPYDPR